MKKIMKKRIGIGILILIAILNLKIAHGIDSSIPTYKPNENIPLALHLINLSGDVVGANVSIQIKNSTQNVILNALMGEIGNGWYNYSYNTSQVGYYYCRQNATLGQSYTAGTCDFIVKGDEKVPIAIIMAMGIVIAVLFILSRYIMIEALKYLLISISAIMTILTLAIGLFLAKDSLPIAVQNLMSTAYIILIYTLDFVIGIGFLFIVIYYVVKWMPDQIKMKFKRKT